MPLYREIGLGTATFVVVGSILGIGIFTTSGLIAGQLGASPWLLGVWLLGGLLGLVGAFCYARLGVLFPRAGGEYAFLKPAFGSLPAFLSGWASLFIGFTAPIAASALGLAHYLGPFLGGSASESPIFLKATASATIIIVSLLLSIGLRTGNQVHSTVTFVNLVLVLGFAVWVLWRVPDHAHSIQALTGTWMSTPWPPLASSVILVMFTYSGWNAAAYIAEEIKAPSRNIPLSLIIGTGLVIILYLLINMAYLSAVPLERFAGKVEVAEITATAILGDTGRSVVNVLILCSILSSLTAMSIAGPRVYYAMARDRLFPAWLSNVHPQKKVPLRSIWFQTALALCFVAIGNLYQILLYSGFIMLLFTTLTVAALLKVSRARVLPLFFIAVNLLVLVNAAISNPFETAAGLLTVALGVPVYVYFRRRSPAQP